MTITEHQGQTPRSRSTVSSHRRPDLQGMRAIAVLTVFSNHLFEWPVGGFVGVDIFFVLSGFFITGILIRERSTSRKLSFENFYVRRVKRILPSALLVLVVTVVGSFLVFPAVRAKATLLDALYAALFAANFRFEAIGADYFQQNLPRSPLQHYWSLSIEEQFYFVWPALLVLIFAVTRKFRRSGKSWARQWALFGAMLVVVCASFGWAMALSADDPNRAYFSSLTRVWELGIGALVAIAGPWLARIPIPARPLLAYMGLAGVVASLFLIDPTVQFPAPWAALPTLATAVVISAFHGGEVRYMGFLTNPVARYFGDTSYTLYLWHWPVIILLKSLLQPGAIYYGTAIVGAMALTVITYHFYEDPIRKSNWLLDKSGSSRKRLTLNLASWKLIGMLAAALMVLSILGIRHADRLGATQDELSSAQSDQSEAGGLAPPAEAVDPCYGAPAILNATCELRNADVALRPTVDRFPNDYPLEVNKCFSQANTQLRSCDFGDMSSDAARIAIVGDSKGLFLLPGLKPVLEANKWRLTTYLGKDCALMEPAKDECKGMLSEAMADLVAKKYDLVLAANITYGVEQLGLRYANAWAPILAVGSRIAVVADNPQSSEEAIACLTRVSLGTDRTGECATSRADAFPDPDALVAAARLVPGVTVIDLTPYYCKDDRCPAVIGNVIVHSDTTHITATFSKTLTMPLEEGIRRALAGSGSGPR